VIVAFAGTVAKAKLFISCIGLSFICKRNGSRSGICLDSGKVAAAKWLWQWQRQQGATEAAGAAFVAVAAVAAVAALIKVPL